MPSVPRVRRSALASLIPFLLASSDGLSEDRAPEPVTAYRECVVAYALRFPKTPAYTGHALLLEWHYLNDNIALAAPDKWNGAQLPGMQRIPQQEFQGFGSWARCHWVPMEDFKVDTRLQPMFKLHGSSNWQDSKGGPMLIMGGNKAQEIRLHPILTFYAEQFEEYLRRGGTRLMVIGYGFKDMHINDAIARAVNERRLQMFIVDPQGSDLARSLNPTRRGGQIQVGTSLEELFERSLIGASRRALGEIFGGDAVEHSKVQRFFSD